MNTRIKRLVDMLVESYEEHSEIIKIDSGIRLNRDHIIDILDKLRRLIFPGYFGKIISSGSVEYYAGDILEDISRLLSTEISQALRHGGDSPGGKVPAGEAGTADDPVEARAGELTFQFLAKIPGVREYLASDVSAAFDGDPAAFNRDEIIFSYPGIYAIMVYRLAHALFTLGVPMIPRIMTEYAHSLTGADIHPGAEIGHHFFIDHGTGIVIGETTIIGNFVKIYQGVTLGGLSTRGGQNLKGVKRHPTIEDHVTIYSGASILGGTTVIGEGVVIGSNAFVTKSVPEKTRVSVKNPELQYKTDDHHRAEKTELEQNAFWDWVI
ncbi:MAG: serine acetyltransferase [Treponema sp.]|jgi:serine O-acetyltransferase|nr:serine acetyltransferase [Treponema sp.]